MPERWAERFEQVGPLVDRRARQLPIPHAERALERYRIAGHSGLVVQAGTLSTRARGEVNTINVLRVDRPRITIERYAWDEGEGSFQPAWNGAFEHTPAGWFVTET